MIPAGPTFGRFQPGCPSDLRFGKSPENSAPYSDEKHHSLYFIAFLSKNDKNYLFCRSSLLSLPHRRLKTGRTPPLRIQQTENGQKNQKKIFAAPSAGHLHLLFPGSGRRIHPQLRAPSCRRVWRQVGRLASEDIRMQEKHGNRATHLLFGGPVAKRPERRNSFPDRNRTRIDLHRSRNIRGLISTSKRTKTVTRQ